MKECKKCGESKAFESFRKDPSIKDGYERVCKSCRALEYATDPKKKVSARRRWLKSAYGIDMAQYDQMNEAQEGKCAICDSPESVLHVDHCHTTGKVRGLLCNDCNTAIGLLKESPEVLSRAISYVVGPPGLEPGTKGL